MHFNKITLKFRFEEYTKSSNLLPEPSYRREISHSLHSGYVIVIYEIKHSITSVKQLRWIANIKESMKFHIQGAFEFVYDEDANNCQSTNKNYELRELQSYFKAIDITYPRFVYPESKKDIYKKLCWYAKSLHYEKLIVSMEMMMHSAIKMNESIEEKDRYSYRELLRKTKSAFDFMFSNLDNLPQKLTKPELKKALSKGGKIRGEQKHQEKLINQQKVMMEIESGNHIKPNGKPNTSSIAKELGLSRETVSRHLKNLLTLSFPFFFIWLSINLDSPII